MSNVVTLQMLELLEGWKSWMWEISEVSLCIVCTKTQPHISTWGAMRTLRKPLYTTTLPSSPNIPDLSPIEDACALTKGVL